VTIPIGTPLEEIERRVIHETLRHTKGDKRLCAQLLGIATRTIYRKLESERSDDEVGEHEERPVGNGPLPTGSPAEPGVPAEEEPIGGRGRGGAAGPNDPAVGDK
jgi:hypothetical protein